jgi:shikimate kinase
MKRKSIILVGFMGSGKTTIGKMLAEQLHYTFIDIDKEIVNGEGQTISSIFEKHGEGYFRKLERQYLIKFADEPEAVISTGGGLPCYKDNMQLINKIGISIYLFVGFERIYDRVSGDDARPLIKSNSKTKIQQLYTARQPYYDQAVIKIHNIKSTEEVVLNIVKELKNHTP